MTSERYPTLTTPLYNCVEIGAVWIRLILMLVVQVKGGVAESDGRLMPGDQILQVNTEDMRNSTQEQAAAVLKVRAKSLSERRREKQSKFLSRV